MQAHHTTRGWLAVEWHLGVGSISLLNFCNAYSSLPGNNHCPLPGDVYSSTFASALPGHVCSPCLGRLPVSCLGTLVSVHALPGHACSPCLGRLPVPCLGTFASALPWHVLQSLPGTLCQFPAWERLPMPCLGMFASPCLGRLPVPCLGTPFAGTPSLAELFSYAYRTSMRRELLHLFKPEMPRTPVPCYFVSPMNVKGRECKAKEKNNQQQPVKEVGGCVRMRGQKEGEVEGGLVCSC